MANEQHPADNEIRRQLLHATVALGTVGGITAAYPFLASMAPSEAAKAAGAPVLVNVAAIAPGAMASVAWRGKPVWILRRTPAMIASLKQHTDMLADPGSERSVQPAYAKNPLRSTREDLSVLVGICTHLGCVPIFRPDVAPADLGPNWFGGYYCPCHGSKFDLAGRVYKNVPAPVNLEVPEHRFLSDSQLRVGEPT